MTPTETINEGFIAPQDHPATDAPTPDVTEQYGPRNERLPEQLVNALRAVVIECQQQESFLRRREVMRAARNRFYERGNQHIYWQQQGNNAGYVMMSPGGVVTSPTGQNVQAPTFIDDYNLFQPFLRIQEAILTQNPPGIDFRAMDPNRIEDCEAAKTADNYRHLFNRANRVKGIQTKIVRMFGNDGRCILWVRTEANAQKWGQNDDGTPKQMETCTVHGTLESKVPILCDSMDQFPYLFLSDDMDVEAAKAEYTGTGADGVAFSEKMKAGMSAPGENNYERYARLGVLQGTRGDTATGQAFAHLLTRMNCWLRPNRWASKKFDDALENADPQLDVVPVTGPDGVPTGEKRTMTMRDKLQQLFPQGAHIVFAGDVYVGSWGEAMDDALIVGHPYEGDGQFRLAMMDPFVVVQDAFNDAKNATREVFDVGWPSRWVDADEDEYSAIARQRAEPFAIRQHKLLPGEKMADKMFQEPNPEIPVTFVQYVADLGGQLPQFMLATPPAIFGASMEDQKTASGYAQARAQAMGQLGLVWGVIQNMFARMYYLAALCASRNPDHSEEIVIPAGGEGETASVRLERISKGKFGAYPDEDSSFPESTEAKRAVLQQILATVGPTPIGMQMLEAPDNFRVYLDLNGFSELVIPEAQSAEKQQFEIQQMLREAPIPPTPEEMDVALVENAAQTIIAQQTGQTPPTLDLSTLGYLPSVPIQEWDRHDWEAKKCQDWLNGSVCRRELAQGNIAGVQNVVLHWKAHAAIAAQQMAAQMMAQAAMAAPAGPPNGDKSKPNGAPKPPVNSKDKPPGAPATATM